MCSSVLKPDNQTGFGPPVLFIVLRIIFSSFQMGDILDVPSVEWETQVSVGNTREK